MDMKTYFSGLDPDQKKELAKGVDTSVAYLMQISSGHRKAGLTLALAIEDYTQGQVTARELAGMQFVANE